MAGGDFADGDGLRGGRMAPQDGQRCLDVAGGDEQGGAAFVGDEEGIEAQQLAGAAHGLGDGKRGFIDLDDRGASLFEVDHFVADSERDLLAAFGAWLVITNE